VQWHAALSLSSSRRVPHRGTIHGFCANRAKVFSPGPGPAPGARGPDYSFTTFFACRICNNSTRRQKPSGR
jgi:hypothetical protein